MPEEILALSIVTIVSATFLILMMTRMILKHKSGGKEAKTEGASMTTSELERIMRRVVEDATSPMSRKLEDPKHAFPKRKVFNWRLQLRRISSNWKKKKLTLNL